MGGDAESVLAPVWRDDRSLYVISDRSGWWNLYLADLLDFPRAPCLPQALCPREEEFASPLWQLGMRPYAVLGDGRIAVAHGTGETRLGVLDPDTGRLTDLDLPYSVFVYGLSAAGQSVATIAGGPAVPMSVIGVDVPASGEEPQAPASTGPASTGTASTGPASTGPASTGPASTGTVVR